ncbi:MAG: sigma-70 family RNA polymerase sigma factor [Ruminococcaceae bacterium]|nr:sigma-70 family RNA polymerase sigma factor [Oscillospiraceae bacterium]
MDDNKIIELLFARSEKALTEVSRKYGKLCLHVATNILGNHADAEECVNDAYLALWQAIPPQRPRSLLAFLLRIVKNICINRYEYNTASKRNSNYTMCLDEMAYFLQADTSVEQEVEARLITTYIEQFLDTLSSRDRILFVRRYWYFDAFDQLAARTGMREGTIRVRLSRMREKLRKYLEERGVKL